VTERSNRDASSLLGNSRAIETIRSSAERVARGDAKVLITGETGVGKDIVAHYIHAHSARAARRFIAVNCAGLTETLLESELFGHVKGAFTGAYRDKSGKFKLAHEGTIFLDEVGEMTMRMQALLLRFLESGEIQPVGADVSDTKVDVRIITATNRDLSKLISESHFREDLFYRIRVVEIHVPPLRERPDDIRPLLAHFAARSGRSLSITDAALRALEAYRWPGNVRELQNVIEQINWMTDRSTIDIQDLPANIVAARVDREPSSGERRRQVADDLYDGLVTGRFEFWKDVHGRLLERDLTRHDLRELIRRGLRASNGNYRRMIELFGMPRQDYKRLLNALATHQCKVSYRSFREFTDVGGDSRAANTATKAG
jgi:transcriptional regulator with PAS, ATPase and Fis domain